MLRLVTRIDDLDIFDQHLQLYIPLKRTKNGISEWISCLGSEKIDYKRKR